MSNVDKIAAEHIKNLLVKVLVPVIKVTRTGPDMLEEYRIDYGYLGTLIHTQVRFSLAVDFQALDHSLAPLACSALLARSIALARSLASELMEKRPPSVLPIFCPW